MALMAASTENVVSSDTVSVAVIDRQETTWLMNTIPDKSSNCEIHNTFERSQ
jgi:hypothetical protein